MPACGSKFVSRSSIKATVAKSVFVGKAQVLGVLSWALTRIRNLPDWCCNAVDKIFQQRLCVE